MIGNNYTNSGLNSLPIQMIPLKEKDEAWRHATMDTLESIGRRQFHNNLRLIENYQMIKGQFIFKHYFDEEEYADMVTELTREFDLPSYLRHYDIISQVINTLSGEWQKRPDVFKVKSFGERYENDFLRAKSDMLLNYIQFNINQEIDKKLLQQGIDPHKTDFKSDDEKTQYLQIVDQQKKILTPKEIEIYMNTKWSQAAEIWGQHQLEFDKQRFKLLEKEKHEFEDMLTTDRCFRHFYISGNTYEQETWNPVNTFFHKSPEVEYIEDGDYAGRVFYLSVNDIVDRYGWLMVEDDILALNSDKVKDKFKFKDAQGVAYGSIVPFGEYGNYKVLTEAAGIDPMTSQGVPTVGIDFFKQVNQENGYYINTANLLQVTEAYWKTQKKIGKVVYIDEDGLKQKLLVDENFIVPKGFKEVNSTFYDAEDVNTVAWTWVPETWKGVKINGHITGKLDRDIYIDVNPLEFQFKGDNNPYKAKIPVCGQEFSVRNSKSMSLVDLMKPHQIGYNVAMNQLYQIMEREIGRFIVMDMNMLPVLKDWGGERSYEKFMTVAKALGVAPIDTSPANINGSASAQSGYFPKDINLDESARMMSRMKIAEFFEGAALKQIGFNEYRLGSFGAESTAGGVENGKQASYSQTDTYFTNFSNYLRRCYTMNLDIAQYVQSKKEDISISYVKSDLSIKFIKIAGTDLLGNQMGVFVSNSQEMVRQLETLRQIALTNNQSGATILDLADMVTMNSPQELRLQLEKSFNEQQAKIDKQYELENQKIQQQGEIAKLKEERSDMRQDKELASKKEIAYINTFSRQDNNLGDSNGDQQPDILEYQKLSASKDAATNNLQLARDKQLLDKDKAIADKEINVQKLELARQKIDADLKIQQEKIQVAKVMKGKSTKK